MSGKNTFDKIETVFVSHLLTKISGYVNLLLQIKATKSQRF